LFRRLYNFFEKRLFTEVLAKLQEVWILQPPALPFLFFFIDKNKEKIFFHVKMIA